VVEDRVVVVVLASDHHDLVLGAREDHRLVVELGSKATCVARALCSASSSRGFR
jgi:hypothetical protein